MWWYKVFINNQALIFKRFSVVKYVTHQGCHYHCLFHGWKLHQLDINNVFLNDKLHEVVYMARSLGFEDPTHSSYICKLQKVIYGLKHASKAWFKTFSSTLYDMGFIKLRVDSSLFYNFSKSTSIYLLVYVDDRIINR